MEKEDRIKEVIKERFKEEYPNTNNTFKEHMECFISWIVDETIKELK